MKTKTNEEKLQFIVKFSQEDLSQFKDWQFLKLKEDFRSFLDIPNAGDALDLEKGSSRFTAYPVGDLSIVDSPTMQPVQQAVHDIFRRVAGGLESSHKQVIVDESRGDFFTGMRQSLAFIRIEEPIEFTMVTIHRDLASMLSLRASLKTCVLMKLLFLFSAEPTSEIKQCKSQKCNNVFYRVRRQEFCSKACSNRDHMARTRAVTTADKSAESDNNHKNYKKRIQKKLGKGVAAKVQRRDKTKKG